MFGVVMGKKYHSITDIVATVYCEQKAVYDRKRGDARPISVRAKAVAGTFEHLRFQVEGQTRQAFDRRCFIASHVYGPDATETNWLRAWRDRELLPSRIGRFAVAVYYAVSPFILPILERSPRLTRLTRAALNRIANMLGRPE